MYNIKNIIYGWIINGKIRVELSKYNFYLEILFSINETKFHFNFLNDTEKLKFKYLKNRSIKQIINVHEYA